MAVLTGTPEQIKAQVLDPDPERKTLLCAIVDLLLKLNQPVYPWQAYEHIGTKALMTYRDRLMEEASGRGK
jgi:hypothetical protein